MRIGRAVPASRSGLVVHVDRRPPAGFRYGLGRSLAGFAVGFGLGAFAWIMFRELWLDPPVFPGRLP